MQQDPSAPVIVAVAQQTWRGPDVSRTPVDALQAVAEAALADSGCAALPGAIDTMATVRFIADTNPHTLPLMPRNPGLLLARRLGIDASACFHTDVGGNTPQLLVNHFAGKLARGEARAVLITGAELLDTFFDALRGGGDLSSWAGEETAPTTMIGEARDGSTEAEIAHGLYEPINTYPLFENALRHHLGGSDADHDRLTAELCAQMSSVAADNPHAWRREALDATTIATVTPRNRYIGYPYTRAMNAILAVDMAAALVMTTAGRARELGIDPQRLVYLRAGGDARDTWYVSQREHLHRAPALGLLSRGALEQAGLEMDQLQAFDIYSCFPSAVHIACNEIGLAALDPRGVTITGGLPFFGGPGNNYSLHAIAEMVDRLRGKPAAHGMVTANGLYLTKHAVGVYSSEPGSGPWRPLDCTPVQDEVDAAATRPLAADPEGPAVIDAFTVAFGREGPEKGVLIASNPAGERLVANVMDEQGRLQRLLEEDPVGLSGQVRQVDGINLFEF